MKTEAMLFSVVFELTIIAKYRGCTTEVFKTSVGYEKKSEKEVFYTTYNLNDFLQRLTSSSTSIVTAPRSNRACN